MTTPNMLLTLPTDHDSADIWDVILDTVFGLIDSHDHTPTKGVPVPVAGLKINADISWSFGGTSWAITDLRAIDFSPQPASGMTALAGAFFLNNADNELYYRTTAGSNVKFTAGAALNVAGFVGGIGGDYSAAQALVVFDDATDAYWFEQQIGASVRQYAKMRSADVALYEFRAVGVTPVPTQAVTLKSPVALAASYAITMPAALPASKATLALDAAGTITASFGPQIQFHIALAVIGQGSNSIISVTGGNTGILVLGAALVDDYLPLTLPVGLVIASWSVYLNKTTTSGTISVKLWDSNVTTGATVQVGATQSNAANNPGIITLGQAGLTTTVQASHMYYMTVRSGGQTGGNDFVYGWSVTPS